MPESIRKNNSGSGPDLAKASPSNCTGWRDRKLGIETVNSPNAVTKNGRYSDLIEEIEQLLQLLQNTSRVYRTKSEENAKLKAQILSLDVFNRKLSDQWHVERSHVKELEDTLSFTRSALRRAEEELGIRLEFEQEDDRTNRDRAQVRRLALAAGRRPSSPVSFYAGLWLLPRRRVGG